MPRDVLEKRALDYLARIKEIGPYLDYCAKEGALTKQVRGFVRVPAADVFPQRDGLLKMVRPALIKAGFEDHIPGVDAYPLWPLWQYVTLDSCQSPTGFDADKLVGQVVDAFGRLRPAAGLVDEFLKSLPALPPLPPPTQRPLRVVAFVDTETAGTGASAKMRQFAVINAAYDATGDQIVGVLDEYSVKSPEKWFN